MCQLHSVPPFSRHLKSSLRIKIFVSQEWAYFLLRYSTQKNTHTWKSIPPSKIKNSAKPLCNRQRSPVVCSPSISGSPPRSTRKRLAFFVPKFYLELKIIAVNLLRIIAFLFFLKPAVFRFVLNWSIDEVISWLIPSIEIQKPKNKTKNRDAPWPSKGQALRVLIKKSPPLVLVPYSRFLLFPKIPISRLKFPPGYRVVFLNQKPWQAHSSSLKNGLSFFLFFRPFMVVFFLLFFWKCSAEHSDALGGA